MALRQNLQRLIVGEVRGAEASALFQAMTVGTGTMFTTHARDPETVPIRLASRDRGGSGLHASTRRCARSGCCCS